jgi:hypothetical protein
MFKGEINLYLIPVKTVIFLNCVGRKKPEFARISEFLKITKKYFIKFI